MGEGEESNLHPSVASSIVWQSTAASLEHPLLLLLHLHLHLRLPHPKAACRTRTRSIASGPLSTVFNFSYDGRPKSINSERRKGIGKRGKKEDHIPSQVVSERTAGTLTMSAPQLASGIAPSVTTCTCQASADSSTKRTKF